MKLIIIIFLGMVLAVLLPYLWLWIAAQREIKKMMKTVSKTGELIPGILTILDGHANVYLVKFDDGYIAIDGGEKPKITARGLAELGIRPEEVKAVLLTHTDVDHAGAVEVFKNAEVFISEEEEQLINGKKRRTFSKMKLPVINKLKSEYKTLKDMEIRHIGNRKVECVLTPGHTPGSMCFLIDDRYLFTGDTVVFDDGKAEKFVELFTMDSEVNKKSIHTLVRRLRDKNIEYVFTAHHGYTNNYKEAFYEWRIG